MTKKKKINNKNKNKKNKNKKKFLDSLTAGTARLHEAVVLF